MPGANCVFPNCGTNRRKKYDGIGIFRISQRKSPFYSAWREKVITIIKKYRVVDKSLKRQIDSWNISICERHYKQDDIEFTSRLLHLLYYSIVSTFKQYAQNNLKVQCVILQTRGNI